MEKYYTPYFFSVNVDNKQLALKKENENDNLKYMLAVLMNSVISW